MIQGKVNQNCNLILNVLKVSKQKHFPSNHKTNSKEEELEPNKQRMFLGLNYLRPQKWLKKNFSVEVVLKIITNFSKVKNKKNSRLSIKRSEHLL